MSIDIRSPCLQPPGHFPHLSPIATGGKWERVLMTGVPSPLAEETISGTKKEENFGARYYVSSPVVTLPFNAATTGLPKEIDEGRGSPVAAWKGSGGQGMSRQAY